MCILLVLSLIHLAASQLPRGRLQSSYQWRTGEWGPCSGNDCGFGGTQRRVIWCEHIDGTTADHLDCVAEESPPGTRVCFKVCLLHRNLFQWQVNDWGQCTQNNNLEIATTGDVTSCGPSSFGLQERTVSCLEISTSYVQRNEDGSVPDYICKQFTAKPSIFQECITPCAQDCIVTQFSPWSPCSKTCDNGTQSRARRVVIPPSNGGQGCPPLSETMACSADEACEVEELFSFSPGVSVWGPCVMFSGGFPTEGSDTGLQTRRLWCQRSDGKTVRTSMCYRDGIYKEPPQNQVCIVPVNCHVSGWSEWSSCSDPCSSNLVSHSVRKRTVLKVPKGDGERCPELVQKRTCSYDANTCPRVKYVWKTSAWSECDILPGSSGSEDGDDDEERGPCGGGLASREVFCTHVNDTASMPLPVDLCDPADRPGTITDCHVPCSKPCRVGPWTSWGPCISFACDVRGTKKAKGHIHRSREIVAPPEHNGLKCPHLTEHAPCNVQPCFKWVVEEATCQPSDAQTMCGEGVMTRNVYCINSQELPVEDESMCEALVNKPSEEVTCDAPCSSDCVLGKWGPWSECSQSCESETGRPGGLQERYRTILAQPGPGGAACPDMEIAEMKESRVCNHHSCTLFGWLTTEWGECMPSLDNTDQMFTPDEYGTCGMGTQTRNVSCSRVSPAKIAPDKRCFAPVRPPASRSCEVQCTLDCEVSEFGDWTSCPTTCSSDGSLATQERRRYILQQTQNGGEECPTLLREERTCNKPDSCYSYTWLVGTWTECRLTGIDVVSMDGIQEQCGDGLKTRGIQCERSDGNIMESDLCLQYGPPMPPSSEQCRVACADDCRMTEWSPWSNCHSQCTGSQIRRRRVTGRSLRQPECTNVAIHPRTDTRPCKCPSYRLVPKGKWSDCLLGGPQFEVQGLRGNSYDEELECGNGIKYRPLVCLDQDDRYVEVSHCGTSQDFMEEHCAIPCPVDCELSDWSDWRSCTGRMHSGIGVTTRWQQVLQQATNGGRPCPVHDNNWIDETKKCSWGVSRLDASWKAGDWETCDVSKVISTNDGRDCGNGVKRRGVSCVIPIDHGFRAQVTNLSACDAGRKPELVEACIEHCPGQCVVSGWTEWTSCPQDCPQDTFRTRNRLIFRNPIDTTDEDGDNPLSCPHLIEREQCMPGINCFTYTWNSTEWSPCQLEKGKICGEGVQDRLLQCLRSDGRIVEVSKCEEFSTSIPLTTYLSCEVACPVDCRLTQWTQWSECSKTCGNDAVRTKHRSILQEPNQKGRPCPATLTQDKPCKAVPCYDWAITQWTECTTLIGECGAGVRRRNVTCRQPNGMAVADSYCLLTRSAELYEKNTNVTSHGYEFLEREHSCEVPCPGECHHTAWSQWSVCHRTCVQGRPIGSEGIQVRSRATLTTDRVCPGDDWETRTCSGERCYLFEWFVGEWERDQRDVWCRRSDGLNVTGACTLDKPSSSSSCNPECHIQSSYCTEDNKCVCDAGYKAIYSMSSGQLEACLHVGFMSPMVHTESDPSLSPGPSSRPGTAGELSDAGETGTGNSVNTDWNNNNNNAQPGTGQKKPTATPKPPQQTFLASLPPWVYAIAAVVVLLIVIVAVVLCCAKCAPKKREEEKKPEPDYSMYWDETVQKKYTGEIEL